MTLSVIKCDCHLSKVFWKRNIGGVSPWGRGAWIVELQPLLVVAYLPALCDLFFVTPQTVAHWPLCPWDFPGKNTGRIAFPFSRGSSQPRDRNHVSSVSCIRRQILCLWATRDAPPGVYDKTKNVFKKNTLVRTSSGGIQLTSHYVHTKTWLNNLSISLTNDLCIHTVGAHKFSLI